MMFGICWDRVWDGVDVVKMALRPDRNRSLGRAGMSWDAIIPLRPRGSNEESESQRAQESTAQWVGITSQPVPPDPERVPRTASHLAAVLRPLSYIDVDMATHEFSRARLAWSEPAHNKGGDPMKFSNSG